MNTRAMRRAVTTAGRCARVGQVPIACGIAACIVPGAESEPAARRGAESEPAARRGAASVQSRVARFYDDPVPRVIRKVAFGEKARSTARARGAIALIRDEGDFHRVCLPDFTQENRALKPLGTFGFEKSPFAPRSVTRSTRR